ncbi:MAG: signal recognition particle receptor subunit alpha, partial [Candidatus Thermoplasmatota archaeon]|nr:signal recognition particle receptor subunit alpha [Candidatus Thermoplasmatota archaeon]
MFKFLKNKLKKFEEKLESELKEELDKEISKSKSYEIKADALPETISKVEVLKKPEEKIELEKSKRKEEIDKQIEKSIEIELEHTLKTRKSIEEVVKLEKKATFGVSEEKLDDLLWDLELGLLESDVAYSVIESIKKDIKDELKHASFERGKAGEVVENVLKNAISHVLESNKFDFLEFIEKSQKPVIIMFVGVNGSGKTLAIG